MSINKFSVNKEPPLFKYGNNSTEAHEIIVLTSFSSGAEPSINPKDDNVS